MADFVPTQFGSIGKSVGDFFKKPYAAGKHTLKSKYTTKQGVTVEHTGTFQNDTVNGQLDASYKCKCLGSFKLETRNEGTVYGTATFNKLQKGLTTKIEFGQKEHADKGRAQTGLYDKITNTYTAKDFVAGEVTVKNLISTKLLPQESRKMNVEATGSIGHEGFSFAACAALNTESSKGKALSQYLDSFDVAAQYEHNDFLGFFKTSNFQVAGKQKLTFGSLYSLSSYKVGSQFEFDDKKKTRVLSLGVQFKADDLTNVNAKYSTNKVCEVAVTRTLPNSMKLVASGLFGKTNKFGFGLTF